MAKFNENVNCGVGYILDSKEFFIYRTCAIKGFERMIRDELYLLTNTYRLFIQYKTTHCVKKMAGRCFLWDNSHGDHMADPGNGIELRSLADANKHDCEGFFKPRFDAVEAAIFITDQCVFAYGDTWIKAMELEEKHVVCNAYVCGCLVSQFRIPADVFDRCFGLEENFPKQYTKPVKVEKKMSTASRRIELAFELIDECFDELRHGQASAIIGWGESISETIDEAIRTYRRGRQKLDKIVKKLLDKHV